MYEKHIKELESWLYYDEMSRGQPDADAVRAAIALMHAAKPLDEDAERKHCVDVTSLGGRTVNATLLVFNERAGARAPLQLEIDRLRSAITNACNALSACDGKGCTAEAVVAELQAVLKGAPPKPRVRLGQALGEFVTDVAEALKKGRDK